MSNGVVENWHPFEGAGDADLSAVHVKARGTLFTSPTRVRCQRIKLYRAAELNIARSIYAPPLVTYRSSAMSLCRSLD